MDKKINRLIGISAVLLLANAWLFFSEPSKEALSYDPDLFTVADTSAITKIKITSAEYTNLLEKTSGWKLNDSYNIDPMFINILMNVVSQVSMSRSLSETELQEIKSDLTNASLVSIEGEANRNFWVVGNANRTQTYFLEEDQSAGYIGEIAGYSDYLGSIFELTTLQWRERVILNGNWRSIQRLRLDYQVTGKNDLNIRFNRDFFAVEGVAALDSNKVVDYLGLYENLQANERIDVRKFPRLDSLVLTDPLAIITLEDIYYTEPQVVSIYPALANSNIQLVLDTQGEAVIFDRRRLSELLRKPFDFQFEN